MKLWGGRFTKPTDSLVEEYTASIGFDRRLVRHDIIGSIAHVRMLGACAVIGKDDAGKIEQGLRKLLSAAEAGTLSFKVGDEDIHMNVERLLSEEIGPLAGKLHTARSRNDQVALDMHLFLREESLVVMKLISNLQESLIEQAGRHLDTILPGYTHLQRAQPILLSHHLLAYAAMLDRDFERFRDAWPRINRCPLGAGALAGTTFPIDREMAAEALAMDGVYENSLDAVSDRDFIVEFLSSSALLMAHLSRLSEELILWSSQEFGFVELDDAFCTGSSIMPQKKNPDVAELVRGKAGRVYGALLGLLTVLKGLPLAYNKDMQEDKEGMFDTIDTLQGALALYAPMIKSAKFNTEKMWRAANSDFSNATDLADYLVRKGLTFREAHEISGKAVLHCIERGCYLLELPLADLRKFSAAVGEDVFEALSVKTVVNARATRGGTSRSRVQEQIEIRARALTEARGWIETREELIKLAWA